MFFLPFPPGIQYILYKQEKVVVSQQWMDVTEFSSTYTFQIPAAGK